MTLLPETTLAHLRHYAAAGQHDAKAMLHLIARDDKRDQDVAEFVDRYSKTISALCRRLGALERRPSAQPATPVVAALIEAESTMADVAEGKAVSPRADECLHWAEARCTEALAAIRPVMRQHGIRTWEFPSAAPTPRPTALVEVVGNELPLLPDGRVDDARTRAAIHGIAAWLDTHGQHGCSALLREEIINQ